MSQYPTVNNLGDNYIILFFVMINLNSILKESHGQKVSWHKAWVVGHQLAQGHKNTPIIYLSSL